MIALGSDHAGLPLKKEIIALLEEKDLEYITVKEICRRAGVNRSTLPRLWHIYRG